MLKRGLFYLIIIALICSLTYKVYLNNQTETAVIELEKIKFNTSPSYTVDTVDQYIAASAEDVHIVFYDSEDTNSIYLFNVVLTQLLKQHKLKSFDSLSYCDLHGNEFTSEQTRERWGFFDYPALVTIVSEDGKNKVTSVIEWDEYHNLTVSSVENWMINNRLLSSD